MEFNWVSLIPGLIPVLTPVVIAAVKRLIARIPTMWLPVLAPFVGGLLDAALAYASGNPVNPLFGAALGLAGVGVREIVDQAKKATG